MSCFASRDKFKLPIYQSCRQIDQNLIFATKSFQYFHFTEYKTKYFRDKVIPILPFIKLVGAYRPKSHFRDKGQSNTFILPNTKPNRFTYHVCNKEHQGTSSNFPFIKLRDMGHSNTFILPNMKLNRFTYHVSHQGTSRKMVNLHIYQTCNHIS